MSKSLKSSPLRKRIVGWQKMKTSRKVWTVILVVVLGYFFVAKPVIGFVDKQKFEKAAAHLEELYVEIEKVAGKPDQVVRDKSCGYSSAKFSKGDLGCGIYRYFLYHVDNIEQAKQKKEQVLEIIGKSTNFKVSFLAKNDFELIKETNAERVGFDMEDEAGLGCGGAFHLSKKPALNKFVVETLDRASFVLELGCGGPAKAEHYPLDN